MKFKKLYLLLQARREAQVQVEVLWETRPKTSLTAAAEDGVTYGNSYAPHSKRTVVTDVQKKIAGQFLVGRTCGFCFSVEGFYFSIILILFNKTNI